MNTTTPSFAPPLLRMVYGKPNFKRGEWHYFAQGALETTLPSSHIGLALQAAGLQQLAEIPYEKRSEIVSALTIETTQKQMRSKVQEILLERLPIRYGYMYQHRRELYPDWMPRRAYLQSCPYGDLDLGDAEHYDRRLPLMNAHGPLDPALLGYSIMLGPVGYAQVNASVSCGKPGCQCTTTKTVDALNPSHESFQKANKAYRDELEAWKRGDVY